LHPEPISGVRDSFNIGRCDQNDLFSGDFRSGVTLAVSGHAMSMLDIARALKASLGDAAKAVPTRQLPDWLVRLMGRFSASVRPLVPLLGNIRSATSAKAERLLGWEPRSREDAVIATAESLLKFGIVGRPS
jgi:dihydroflavonol-4-reductase